MKKCRCIHCFLLQSHFWLEIKHFVSLLYLLIVYKCPLKTLAEVKDNIIKNVVIYKHCYLNANNIWKVYILLFQYFSLFVCVSFWMLKLLSFFSRKWKKKIKKQLYYNNDKENRNPGKRYCYLPESSAFGTRHSLSRFQCEKIFAIHLWSNDWDAAPSYTSNTSPTNPPLSHPKSNSTIFRSKIIPVICGFILKHFSYSRKLFRSSLFIFLTKFTLWHKINYAVTMLYILLIIFFTSDM